MIQPLRIVVLILGLCFAYFFGETLERFLMEVVRYFSPDTCLIQGPRTIMRKLHGWIDVEKAAERVLAKP